ncbi:MAG: sensor domain-containing diguanylate cyclase [Gemmatimonadaceae bacterium]|nr:sensor domain-containing diguanylate cyclase [Gemmatimonadaceae bacterium]
MDRPHSVAEENEALTQFLYLAPVGLTQLSMSGEILMLNPISAQLLMPLSRDGGLENLFTALEGVAPELRYLASNFVLPHGRICDGMRVQLNAGVRGVSDPQFLSLTLLKLDESRLMAVLSDITLQVKRERLLRQNEAWFNAILAGVTDYALVRLDGVGRVEAWNTSIGRVTGFSEADVIGRPYSIFSPDDATTADRDLDRLHEADASGWSIDEGWRVKADATRYWGSAAIVPLIDRAQRNAEDDCALDFPDDAQYCMVIRDITERRAGSEKHRLDTICDHLTGIANRRTFFEAGELEIERYRRSPRPVSLLLFDADNFKRVNDVFGHAGGDAVLRHLATLLASTFRQVDVVARLGGEEFAVLLPSCDLSQAVALAERFRRSIEAEGVEVDGEMIHYTVSGGIAAMDDSVSGLDALVKRADDALYAAKAAGRNRLERWPVPAPAAQVT